MIESPTGCSSPQSAPEWERICQALIDLVLERGYELTTIEAIVARAGVERTEFDRFFSDKEDCFVQAFWTYVVEVFEGRVFAAFEQYDNWRDGLRASAYEAARFIRDNPRESRFGSIEMMQVGPVAQAHRERQLHRIVDLIDAGRQELDDPDSVNRAVAEAALGAIYTMAIKELSEGGGAGAGERLVPELMYLAVRPYLGDEVAREELTIPPPAEQAGED
jgi:AcrR family transcriptional regulator